jgi:hypothetical protein
LQNVAKTAFVLRPQQQVFGLLTVGVEGRSCVDEAREPPLDGVDVILRRNLRTVAERAVS